MSAVQGAAAEAVAAAQVPDEVDDASLATAGQSEEELHALKETWIVEQQALKARALFEDDIDWQVPTNDDSDNNDDVNTLRYVGGVDISFVEGSETEACAALVVLELPSLKVVYSSFNVVQLVYPYIAGFLAFREVPFLLDELRILRETSPELMPQVILVDGNGRLHHRGFGLASHLGVEANIPTIGVAKNLLCIDGLQRKPVEATCREVLKKAGDTYDLVGESGTRWGVALRTTDKGTKQVYVSAGHRLSLETAVAVVCACSQHKIPEPVRQADLGSREVVRKWVAAREAAAQPSSAP